MGFNGLLDRVDELTEPNSKLRLLNTLFEQITRLDQQQRANTIRLLPARRACWKRLNACCRKINQTEWPEWD